MRKNMNRFVAGMLAAFLFGGCAGADQYYAYASKPPSSPVEKVGEVEAYKYLKYSGKLVQEVLAVKIDGNGNTILLAREGQPGEIAIYLAEDARKKVLSSLLEIREIRAETKKNPVGDYNYTKSIVTGENAVAPSYVVLSYDINVAGEQWACIVDLSGYDIEAMTTTYMGIPGGRSSIKLFLMPSAVESFQSLVEKAHLMTSTSQK